MKEKLDASIARVIRWGLIATTLVVTPLWSLDPINPVKMLVVVPTGFICSALMFTSRKSIQLRRYGIVLILSGSFLLWQILVLIFSGGQLLQQLFGTNGRNTGFITYLAFVCIFFGAVVSSGSELFRKLIQAVFIVGIASLGYGLIQQFGADPFKWVNSYSAVFGFLGNPNFQSSLLGVLGSILFAQLLSKNLKIQYKGLIITYLLVTLFVIKATVSSQGFLVFAIGITVVIGLFLYQKSKGLTIVYGFLSLIGLLLILFGTLQKGPLASLLYQDSVTYRGDYWRAGWNMTLKHPIFGVGMDSYGDWYRRSRTLAATLRRGPDITSNAAHNVFIDISSYGGFPLMLIYVGMMVLVVISAVKVIRRSQRFNPIFVGLVAGWIAFQSQSIISINQIGLGVWGWVLSGAIIGYEINTRSGESQPVEVKKSKRVKQPVQNSANSVVAMFIACVVGVLVAIPPYLASAKFKGALESGNINTIRAAAYYWPLDPSRMIQVSMTLNVNKEETEALKIARDTVHKFPNNYSSWSTLNSMLNATPKEKAQALAEMKRLDPLNPNLK